MSTIPPAANRIDNRHTVNVIAVSRGTWAVEEVAVLLVRMTAPQVAGWKCGDVGGVVGVGSVLFCQ